MLCRGCGAATSARWVVNTVAIMVCEGHCGERCQLAQIGFDTEPPLRTSRKDLHLETRHRKHRARGGVRRIQPPARDREGLEGVRVASSFSGGRRR